MTAELRAQGRLVNRKRVIRLMRVDNLLCLRKRRFVCTTDSRHTYSIYPNLTTDWKPTGSTSYGLLTLLTSDCANHFSTWQSFLDAYSRRFIGWKFSGQTEVSLTINKVVTPSVP